MADTKDLTRAPIRRERDPFGLLRQVTSELDRIFEEPFWGSFKWPAFRTPALTEATWAPKVDVFEKHNRLFTRIDLPGVKRDDVTVEVTDGHLVLSGERRIEKEETKENVYHAEREYGTFRRIVPLPEGVALDDVKATFADGVLEVSVPLPARAAVAARKVPIETPGTEGKTAA